MQQTENLAPHVQEIARALSNRMEPDAIEDELRRYLDYGVPLAQAKRDIVRMHGGTLSAGAKKIAHLQPEDRGVDLEAVKVLTVNPKEITVKGAAKTIWYGFVGDDTGKTAYTAWKDLKLARGAWVKVRNAYAKKGFREGVDLQLGDYTIAEPTADPGWAVKDDFQGSDAGGGQARLSAERTIRELRDGLSSVTITARVLEANEKTISTVNGQKTLLEGVLADGSGRVAFSAWEPEKLPKELKADAVVRVKGAYVRAFRGVPQLNFGQYATVEILPSTTLPDSASLQQERPYTLGELEAAGGGNGILVHGIVLEVKKGSGIIERCPVDEDGRTCNRVMQQKTCRIHNKQKPTYDLRIKAVLDDGRGVATFFADREVTEAILGKTLAEAQEMARDAMTTDVVQDELTRKLTARRVTLRGRASSSEFGLTLNADELSFSTLDDAQTQAEKLLGSLIEFSQEVA